jgi:D-alanyl-D-alanine carboxypeptidase (penicillin-binding protein 5/6)
MRIIYEKEPTTRLAPASMTKIMTMILVMESLDTGRIKLDDIVSTPEVASDLGGSQIYLAPEEKMSVHDLLKSVAIASANDAAMSLGVYIGGSEENFVKMMNDKVIELKLENTNFVNPYGFDDPNHYSCSRDMAMMSAYLINNYPEILKYTSMYESYVREDNIEKKFWLVNTNKLVKFMSGVDGLKTGWTDEAGYCLSCTINKNGMRFISVSMGCVSPKLRQTDTMAMLNFATSNYEVNTYIRKGDSVASFEDVLTKPMKFKVVVNEDLNILKPKGEKLGTVTTKIKLDNLKLKKFEPIVGTMELYYNGQLYKTVELSVLEDVEKSSFWDVFLEVLKEIFLVS